jgi:hypothetical protein
VCETTIHRKIVNEIPVMWKYANDNINVKGSLEYHYGKATLKQF